jgi:hypothetical protein
MNFDFFLHKHTIFPGIPCVTRHDPIKITERTVIMEETCEKIVSMKEFTGREIKKEPTKGLKRLREHT